MITQLAIIAIAVTIGLILGYAAGSKPDTPVKRTNSQMNYEESLRAENRRLTALLDEIRDYTVDSKTGRLRVISDIASKGSGA